MSSSGKPLIASDAWMEEQQLRAELEAQAWRRLRQELAEPLSAPEPYYAPPLPAPPQADPHETGSTILKAIVRFVLASFGAYLAWIAAKDSQLGQFEIWFATGSGFVGTLALTMFGGVRRFVHFLAETMRWVLLFAIGVGAAWLAFHTWT